MNAQEVELDINTRIVPTRKRYDANYEKKFYKFMGRLALTTGTQVKHLIEVKNLTESEVIEIAIANLYDNYADKPQIKILEERLQKSQAHVNGLEQKVKELQERLDKALNPSEETETDNSASAVLFDMDEYLESITEQHKELTEIEI